MNERMIRRYSLMGKNKEIKALLITKSGKRIYDFVFKQREATSAQVASHFGISIQNASRVLNKLYNQQYLRRDQWKQESGGYEWNYFI